MSQTQIAYKLHKIKEVVIINHEDCGAYGEDGQPLEQVRDLEEDRIKITERFNELKVRTYFLRLDGAFEQVS